MIYLSLVFSGTTPMEPIDSFATSLGGCMMKVYNTGVTKMLSKSKKHGPGRRLTTEKQPFPIKHGDFR